MAARVGIGANTGALQVDLPPGKLTKGGASDLIDAALASLATPLQLRQLQVKRGAGDVLALADLTYAGL